MTETKLASPTDSAGAGSRARFRTWMLAAVLGLGTLALYWPVTQHAFVDYDDDLYVTANVHVQQGLTPGNLQWIFCHLVCGNWHPVTMFSHLVDCQLYGLRPWGHHFTNISLHAANAVLLFLWLYRVTGARWRSAGVAALFAWHPLHVESVAWVAERKDVLSTGFGWLALLFYTHYAAGRPAGNPASAMNSDDASLAHNRSRFYWLAWGGFALGLLSKPMLVTWPFLLLLLDYWPLERFHLAGWRRLWREKIPFFALAAAASLVTFLVQKWSGAVKTLEVMPLGMRCENAVISYCRYLFKLFWPVDLAVFYPQPASWPLGQVLLAGGFLGLLTLWFWRERRRYPFLLVGWLWFIGTLVPVIGLVQVGIQAMADRYSYIPSVGLLILIVWGGYELSRRWRQQAIVLSLAVLAGILLSAAVTRQQIGYWEDSETLFRHALKVTADNDVARNNLGMALLDKNQTNAAISEFQAALHLKPNCVEAHNNLGNALIRQGETDAAITQYQETIRLEPALAAAHNNLGTSWLLKGQTNAASRQFQEALHLQPDYVDARYNLAVLLATLGQTNEAIHQYQEILRYKPDDAGARYALGCLLDQTGQSEQAITQLQTTIRLKADLPGAHNNLGNMLAKQNRIDEAIRQFQAAIRLQPVDFEAHNNLGNLLATKGQTEAATSQFQEALRLKPDYADAHFNWGNLLAKTGHPDTAVREFQAALNLKPDDAEVHYKLGNLFAKLGQVDAAMDQFQAALRLKPAFPEAYNNLGNLLAKQGRTDEAAAQFQEAIRLKPDYADAHYNLGQAWLKQGRLEESISQFQTVVQLSPEFAPAHYYLGLVLTKTGQANAALPQFQAALRLNPNDAAAHDKLGIVLGGQGQLDDAILEFQAALQLKPDYAEASNNLARALELKGAPNPERGVPR